MNFSQKKNLLLTFLLAMFSFQLSAQNDTNTINTTLHSAKKATIYSAILPGLGQVYNEKIWKVPVIYAGFGALGYMFTFNNGEYKIFKNAYALSVDNDPNTYVEKFKDFNSSILKNARDKYRKNRDLSLILAAGWYLINIMDANVDGHLYDFKTQDFSLIIDPVIYQNQAYRNSIGLSCKISF